MAWMNRIARWLSEVETNRANAESIRPRVVSTGSTTGGAFAALVLLASLAFLLSCDQDDAAFGPQDEDVFEADVRGRVRDHAGRPLSGAVAMALPAGISSTTASDGSFALKGLVPGSYRVVLFRDGYRDTAWKDSVRLGLAVSLDLGTIAMGGRFGAVSGRTLDSAGAAAPGAGVAVQSRGGAVVSGGDARFVLSGIEVGRVRLVAALQGVGWGSVDTLVRSDDTLEGVAIRLRHRGGTVEGRVVGPDGRIAAKAVVSAFGGALETATGSDGTFVLEGVPTGPEVAISIASSNASVLVTGVRASVSARTDLATIQLGGRSSGSTTVQSSFANAFTTDSVITLRVESGSSDSTFRVLRHLWSFDGGKTWDTTSSSSRMVEPALLDWSAGVRTVLVKLLSTDGRTSSTGRVVVRIALPPDWTPPRIERVFPGADTTFDWRDSVVVPRWKVSDDRRLWSVSIDSSEVSIDQGEVRRKLVLPVGTRVVRLLAVDSSGNATRDSLVLVRRVRPDIDPPVLAWTGPTRDTSFSWKDSVVEVSWRASDDHRLDSVSFEGDATAPATDGKGRASIDLEVGTRTVRLWARDSAGNIARDSLRLTRLERPDTTLPTIERIAPSKDTTFRWSDSVAVVAWRVSDDRRLGVVRIDTTTVELTGDTARATLRLPTGVFVARIVARDSAGNVASDSLVLTRRSSPDTTAPRITRLRPGRDTTYAWEDSVATVAWKVLDDKRLDSVFIDTVSLGRDSLPKRNVALRLGANTIRLRARDSAGNVSLDSLILTRAARTTRLDTTLGLLKVDVGRLSPSFHPDSFSYRVVAGVGDSAITVQALPLDTSCVVVIAGRAGTSRRLSLGAGGTTTDVRIVVRALDGDSLVYGILVDRPRDTAYGIPLVQNVSTGVLRDPRDGQEYRTVRIGDQNWMAENLAYAADSSWCPTGVADSCAKYGRLYSWAAVLAADTPSTTLPSGVRGICPTGWHVPSDAEWAVLADHIAGDPRVGEAAAGTALKALGGWGNTISGTDIYGFRAMPAGYRFTTDGPTGLYAHFWSSTRFDGSSAYLRSIYHYYPRFYRGSGDQRSGYSLRCLEDIPDTTTALRALDVSRGRLSPAFDPSRTVHDDTVGASVESLLVTAAAVSKNATVAIEGGGRMILAEDSVLSIVVTNGSARRTYHVRVFHDPDTTYGIPWNQGVEYGVLRDSRDGNEYRTVHVGGRRWMAENLAYRADSSWCYAGDPDSCAKHGRLYSWAAAMALPASYASTVWNGADSTRQGVCPSGWRLPSDAEWSSMVAAVEALPGTGSDRAGTALKSSRGWSDEAGGTDALGFRALPSGYASTGGSYGVGGVSRFWSSTGYAAGTAWSRAVFSGYSDVYLYTSDKSQGYSVRCIEVLPDTSASLKSITVSQGRLSPAFDPARLVYDDTVGASVGSVVVTAQAASGKAVVVLGGGGALDLLTDSVATIRVTNGSNERYYAVRFHHRPVDTTWGVPVNAFAPAGVLRDERDGKDYRTVRVGDQNWMAENLDHVVDSSWCQGGEADSCAKYGRLYSWTAAMGIGSQYLTSVWTGGDSLVRGACPVGWHLPTASEWDRLVATVEADPRSAVGLGGWALKAGAGWNAQGHGPDLVGFRALPAGYTYGSGAYGPGNNTGFWTTNSGRATTAQANYLYYNVAEVYKYQEPKRYGYSVRCLEDPLDTSTALASLAVGSGRLSPVFQPSLLEYVDTVAASAESLAVTASAVSGKAVVTIDGGGKVVLASDSVIDVRVANGSGSRVYTIRVHHRPVDTTWGIPVAAASYGVLRDARDGQEYRTVRVGDQNWMAENLSYAVDSSWCPSTDRDSCAMLGRFYSWSAAMGFSSESEAVGWAPSDSAHRGVCPAGWHLPVVDEWTRLEREMVKMGIYPSDVSASLRSAGGWTGVGQNGSDKLGFRVVPSGFRYLDGGTYALGSSAIFWTAEPDSVDPGMAKIVHYSTEFRGRSTVPMPYGHPVRCLEDVPDTSTALASLRIDRGTLSPAFLSTSLSYDVVLEPADTVVVVSARAASPLAVAAVSGGDAIRIETDSVATIDVANGASSRTYTIRFARRDIDTTWGVPWNETVSYGVLRDERDNKTYRTVRIGGRNWMAENLNHAVDSSSCLGGEEDSCAKYGRLYTWTAAMDLSDQSYSYSSWSGALPRQGVCPSGWHLPDTSEYRILQDSVQAVAGADSVGVALRAVGAWDGNREGTDLVGFRLLPAGGWGESVPYTNNLWTSVQVSGDLSFARGIWSVYSMNRLEHKSTAKNYHISVRCIEDLPDTTTALASLHVGRGDLAPVFDPATTSYTDTLLATDTFLVVSAQAASTSAVATVSGGGRISLGTDSIVAIEVVNGTRSRTYGVRVVRKPAPADSLWGIPLAGVPTGTLRDVRDGQEYRTVNVGGKAWMAENLNYASPGSKCYADAADSCAKHGRLYTWASAMLLPAIYQDGFWMGSESGHRGACPEGWHVPSDPEWGALLDSFAARGGAPRDSVGRILRAGPAWSAGTGTDSYGLRILASGYQSRYSDVPGQSTPSSSAGAMSGMWTSSQYRSAPMVASFRLFTPTSENVPGTLAEKTNAFSLRCVEN